ncbi:MAG: helicase C-terminal domain-containing protein [Bacilli bacterium]
MPHILYLSVHDIVDVLLRRGHLDTRIFNQASMLEGTRLHALYQSQQGENYISEYPLEYTFRYEDFMFVVSGKADGVIINEKKQITVEEIKTTVADLNEFSKENGQWHLGQALFYAYILSVQQKVEEVKVVLTYLKQSNYRISKKIEKTYSADELSSFVEDLIARYALYIKKIQHYKNIRDESCKKLNFPFKEIRGGQQDLMDFVIKACEEKEEVFVEAPTGIGKTVSVLYPTICRFGEKKADRIFYLTAKNSIKKIAMSTIDLFIQQGAKIKSIEFTSQERICFNDKVGHCNPDECPYARNYYDKLFDTIFDCLEAYDLFDRKTIEEICYKKKMCPFQFQLDLSRYCDVLVCDYTYVYDYHDRLGLEESNIQRTHSILLVDECHNLPDRVRDMYSLYVTKHQFEDALSVCGGVEFKSLKTDIEDSIKLLAKLPIDTENDNFRKNISILKEIPGTFENDLNDILVDIKTIIKKHTGLVTDPLMEFFFNINSLVYLISQLNDEENGSAFLCYLILNDDKSIQGIKIINLDCRPVIKSATDYFETAVFFSATLSPKNYYIDLLGGDINDLNNRIVLKSPFPLSNRRVFVDTNLSLRYKDREKTMFEVFCLVKAAVSQTKGNYLVFCPSFQYLSDLTSFFESQPIPDSEVYFQEQKMGEEQRDDFLSHFKPDNKKTVIGFTVIGGIFSEGIDLVGERLIGAIIISVGLPQISFERDRIKDYYDKISNGENQKGFSYAYTYPGLNRVLQAAGRVIRSETDKGFILFIDSRFSYQFYRDVFKEIYPDCKKVISASELRYQLKIFWEDSNK